MKLENEGQGAGRTARLPNDLQLPGRIDAMDNPFLTGPQGRMAKRLAARFGLAASTAAVLAVLVLNNGGRANG